MQRRRVTDIEVCPETGSVTSVSCGDETFPADAVVSAVGINGVKGIVRAAPGLSRLPFFSRMMNLRYRIPEGSTYRLWCNFDQVFFFF